MYQFDRGQQTITIAGSTFGKEDFRGVCQAGGNPFEQELYLFLHEWFSDSPTLLVQTSGSTGKPKEMLVEKEKMMQSARMTCDFLNLKEKDKALLCMSLRYIGAKMVVVRALIAGLDLYLVSPSGNPLKNMDTIFDFAAMVPMQVFNSLQNEKEKSRLKQIKKLIIGGGSIDQSISDTIKDFPNHIYSTYGMTETLSHIALRKLNGADSSEKYYPFDSVHLSLSEDSALIIDAPLVNNERLYTNDIAEIYEDGGFRIIGRKDNIINSGGIKIQAEEVEKLLSHVLDCPFAISSIPDPKFGEVLVLVVERETNIDEQILINTLPPYFVPKMIIKIDKIPQTETGKINRVELKKLIMKK